MTLTDRPELRVCPLCDARVDARICPHDGSPTVRPSELVARRVADPLLGATLDSKYVVEERIGVGSMGSVYRAQNLRTGATVAIKVMHAALAESAAAVRRFLLEAQNAGRMDNPHIVRVLDRGETIEGLPFMVMEHLDGRTLESILAEGPLAPSEVVAIAEQMVKGLGEAHRRGLVHRDIKPENVMLLEVFGEDLHVKLLDFGIARAAPTGDIPAHGTMVLGTPRYMAPEQWSATAVLDARSDLYSLGCVLYHMVAGQPPFVVEALDERRLVQLYQSAHMTQLPPALPIPAMSPLAMLIDDLLRKDPAQRPPSAEEVLRRLRLMRTAPDVPPGPKPPRSRRADDRGLPELPATDPAIVSPSGHIGHLGPNDHSDDSHPGVVMATMMLAVEQDAEPEPVTDAEAEPTMMLPPDDDGPTRALLSPGLARRPGQLSLNTSGPPSARRPVFEDSEDMPGPLALKAPPEQARRSTEPPPLPMPSERTIVTSPAPPQPPVPGTRRILNAEPEPPTPMAGLRASDAITDPGQKRPQPAWAKWVVGTVVAIVLGVLLGVVLGGH